MPSFEIKEDFYLNDKPFKILSGAIHYFRLAPGSWYRSLYNLKALGFNTVETYIPWNLHEAKKGEFNFEGIADLERFLDLAQEMGLYAIIRPSPYICAEWEFGGLPAWLLKENVRVRSSDQNYLNLVANYYKVLMPKLVKRQLSQGGNILMFQLENEYGSYGEDKTYLKKLMQLMRDFGITAPLFTSDGPWQATLRAGSLIDENILVTGNFGSKSKANFSSMQAFFEAHNKKWPLMCMEFWVGWFNRWKEPIIKRDPQEMVDAIMEVLAQGSINLYMFHGGTNFGFMNGASARLQKDLPQVTSYDYDAILDEAGNPTAKYFLLQECLKKAFPALSYSGPLYNHPIEIKAIPLVEKVNLVGTLDSISQVHEDFYPQNMEDLGQNTGYILYRTKLAKDSPKERLRLIDARDRAQLFLDNHLVASQYQFEIGDDIFIEQKHEAGQVDILVENMGRVSYGHKLTAASQRKGLGRGLMADLHFIGQWQHYCLPLETVERVDYSGNWQEGLPSFYAFDFKCDKIGDSYLDVREFGKGVAFINNINLGRFWNEGPHMSLYIPEDFLKLGKNRIVIFETEGLVSDTLNLVTKPIFKEMIGEKL
ncbi:beta-galactosidase [Streptococcus didelphis]|uniref:Beta-galactosidase n=1 Tax=Streptococcus didelphis TaxID=102886 RepID=A0ABY9LFY9_9STRE|nr:beta-galactosidase family protein [Streptococcus didelphis]WMB27812.1 beta-galactosidase [Streptococcus didelphis]